MRNILSSYIVEKKRGRGKRLRALVALFLLSAVVASTVIWSLRLVGTTLSAVPVYEAAPQAVKRTSPGHRDDTLPLTPPAENASGGGTYKPLAVTDGGVSATAAGDTNLASEMSYTTTGVKDYVDNGQLTDGVTGTTACGDGKCVGFYDTTAGPAIFEITLGSVSISKIRVCYYVEDNSGIQKPSKIDCFINESEEVNCTVNPDDSTEGEHWIELTFTESNAQKVRLEFSFTAMKPWVFISEIEIMGTKNNTRNLALNLPYTLEGASVIPANDSLLWDEVSRPNMGQLTDGIVGSAATDPHQIQHKDGTYVGFQSQRLQGGGTTRNDKTNFYTFEVDLKVADSAISEIYLEYLEWQSDKEGCPVIVKVYVDDVLQQTATCTPASVTGQIHRDMSIILPFGTKGHKVTLQMTPYHDGIRYYWLFVSEIKVLSTATDTEFKVEYCGNIEDIHVGDTPSTYEFKLNNVVDTRDDRTGSRIRNYGAGGGDLPQNGSYNLANCYIDGNFNLATDSSLTKLYRDKYYHRDKAPQLENIDILANNSDWRLTGFQINDGTPQIVNTTNYDTVFGTTTINHNDTVKLIYTPNTGSYTHKNPYFFDYDISSGPDNNNYYRTARQKYGTWLGCGINSPWPEVDFRPKNANEWQNVARTNNYCAIDNTMGNGVGKESGAYYDWSEPGFTRDEQYWHSGCLNDGEKNKNNPGSQVSPGVYNKSCAVEVLNKSYTSIVTVAFDFSVPRTIVEVDPFFCHMRKAVTPNYSGNRGYPSNVKAYVSSDINDRSDAALLGERNAPGNLQVGTIYNFQIKNLNAPKTGRYLILVITIESGKACIAINEIEIWSTQAPFVAFGNCNTGMPYADPTNDGGSHGQYLLWNGQMINGYNWNNNEPSGKNGATFGMVKDTLLRPGDAGWPEGEMHYNSGLEFNITVDDPAWYNNSAVKSHSAAPCMFKHIKSDGKRRFFNDMSLTFAKAGDTYTLSSVGTKNGSDTAYLSELDKFQKLEVLRSDGTFNKYIYSNMFWPMDKRTAAACGNPAANDPLFGNEDKKKYWKGVKANGGTEATGYFPRSDDSYVVPGNGTDAMDHNAYFGMHFDMKFSLTNDYIGPLNYFFYGDDDMWVYLDKRLICDIGGVHSSIGELVNLWDWLSPYKTGEHTLSFYYTERGASGSSCYMRFNLPGLSEVPPPNEVGSLLVAKEVTEKDGFAAPADKTFKFEITLTDGEGQPYTDSCGVSVYGDYTAYYANGSGFGDLKRHSTFTSGTTEVVLKANEFALIEGLPVGTRYTVEEIDVTDCSATATADRILIPFSSTTKPIAEAALSPAFKYTSVNSTNIQASYLSRVHFNNLYPLGGPELPSTGGVGRELVPVLGLTAVIFSSLAPVVLRGDKRRSRAKGRGVQDDISRNSKS